VAARLGIRRLRVTGGEPLVRKGITRLIEMLVAVRGIDEVAMTTNGVLLEQLAESLKAAGLSRLNISLDTLDRLKFQEVTRRDELPRVLAGIAAARKAGFTRIKLNALAIRDFTETEIVPLVRFAREHDLQLRFIEFMPADADRQWDGGQVLSGEDILRTLREQIGPLEPVASPDATAPAAEYRFVDGGATIGLIRSVTMPFCEQCDRLRLTADGQIRNCLFATRQWDARPRRRPTVPAAASLSTPIGPCTRLVVRIGE
jgi:cyclic pyranopterin phosphate synthase